MKLRGKKIEAPFLLVPNASTPECDERCCFCGAEVDPPSASRVIHESFGLPYLCDVCFGEADMERSSEEEPRG